MLVRAPRRIECDAIRACRRWQSPAEIAGIPPLPLICTGINVRNGDAAHASVPRFGVPQMKTAEARESLSHDDRAQAQARDMVAPIGIIPTPLATGDAMPLRRLATGDDPLGGTAAPSSVLDVLRRRSGGGAPLPESVRSSMGERSSGATDTTRSVSRWVCVRLRAALQVVATRWISHPVTR